MHILFSVLLSCSILTAQDAPVQPAPELSPTAQPAAPPAVVIPVVPVDIEPLSPPDLETPYASPRDAARHRFQATLADLQSARGIKAGLQGFAESLALDRTYAPAAFNLGILAAIAEKWDDALSALEESARLDPSLGKAAASQVERLRLIRSLAATPEGRRRYAYDGALYPVLKDLPKLNAAEALAALADVGKTDPKRWEAPALLAGLNGSGRSYDVAARFLEIALSNAAQPPVKERLQKALEAAQRELRYAAARATADAAADRGEYDKAGELYEKTWAVIPARASNGMEAASAWLLHDDTAKAAALLARLLQAGDTELAGSAAAMLKELESIEPGAKMTASEDRDFFKDAGPAAPVFISDLLPPIDQSEMELLARPLPKLVTDSKAVALLTAFAASPANVPPGETLPVLPAPRVAGESPWRELSQLRTEVTPPAADPAGPPQERGSIVIETASTDLRVNGTPVPNPDPVELSLKPGLYRIEGAGADREIMVKPGARLRLPLH